MRNVQLIHSGVRLDTLRASIDPNMDVAQPSDLGWELLLQPTVIMMVTTQGTAKKNDKLVRQGHDRVFQRMLFFFPL